jgi:hypothetical protein
MTKIPKSILLALLLLGSFGLNSLIAQILLMQENHKTSWVRFAIWFVIYFAIGLGLHKGNKLAFWFAMIISVMQVVPLVISWLLPMSQLFGQMPSWYNYSLFASAALGIALLVVLVLEPTRNFIFGARPDNHAT